ncbi:MAG: HAD-IIA family hydrolase [Anaerolineales bacterium]|nr:HAD-IIA family hydrolase [Anaerolineales bacterium]
MSDQPLPRSIRGLILDMDGVLWRQNEAIGNLPGIFSSIQARRWRVTLATNNATLSVAQYLDKLAGFGVHLEAEQIVNSSLAAANYLKRQYPQGGTVYVIGEEGLLATLREYGFQHGEQDVLAVVVGMNRQLHFNQLSRATLLLRSGVAFVGTNADRTFPVPEGLIPGVGATLAALEVASGVHPRVVGKPEPEMYLAAIERMGCAPAETLVVGDRLETDILGAQQLSMQTALVLSGVTTPEAASRWTPPPDFIAPSLTDLIKML